MIQEFNSTADLLPEGEMIVPQGTVLIDNDGKRWIVLPTHDRYHLNGCVMRIGPLGGPCCVSAMAYPVVISADDNGDAE